ncbi:TPA: DUF485 domain-containing protein [Klebsiella pneumoniae]|nr:DUF485 domain-containing protein [Klebsiella quasipneumoniae]
MKKLLPEQKEQNLIFILGLCFAVVLFVVFFSFVAFCVFKPAYLSMTLIDSGIPFSFIYAGGVILFGVVLTVMYVLIANNLEGKTK